MEGVLRGRWLTQRDREGNRLTASVLLCVKTSACTWATIVKDEKKQMVRLVVEVYMNKLSKLFKPWL